MKYLYLLAMVLIPQFAMAQAGSVAWFTDAAIEGTVKTAKPADAPPDTPGSYGNGVLLNKSVALEAPSIQQSNGLISFWIKPGWNGNDSQTHKILRIGDPATNGLLVEKSDQNMLRYVMAGGGKVTASRVDVSGWKTGEWHHIAISWIDLYGSPIGIPLWVDKVAVDGPIYGGTSFMNPATMADKRILIGDTSTNATMDELICHSYTDSNQVTTVYQDYFRTAPYTAIQITNECHRIKSETRAVVGCPKQFGVKALKEGKWEYITDFDVRYGQWSDFDAKPYITWSTSNYSIASVDTNGRTYGNGVGHCNLTAQFRGMNATYDLEVIPINQPDLDLLYVERTPRYSRLETKQWPSEGENVHSIAHIGNFGYTTVPGGTVTVKFERIPDTNKNFVLDSDELPIDIRTATISQSLAPRESAALTFDWTWTQSPVFIRVTIDPNNTIPELCEANNQRCELNTARAFHWGRNDQKFYDDHNNKQINHVGSFSDYDWCNGEIDRTNVMLRETVLPTTSPYGIKDSLRSDDYMSRNYGPFDQEPWELYRHNYDGGYPDMEPQNDTLMDMDPPIIHEIGHVCLTLSDNYGYTTKTYNMFMKDANGNPYADSPLYPAVTYLGEAPFCSAYNVPCKVGYPHLMINCHMWLHPASAGITNHFGGTRMDLTRVDFKPLTPTDNRLRVYDVEDKPLKGAAIYVYQMVNPLLPDANTKYIPDRPKFIGNTDDNGIWVFPKVTDPTWDDWTTDQVDGAVSVWNPFKISTADFIDPSWVGGDMFIIKIVSGNKTELQLLPYTEFLREFYCGRGTVADPATYDIRTSLASTLGVTPTVPPTIPAAIKVTNRKPIAVVPNVIFIKPGEPFNLDGSDSYDPEGQPLTYRWIRRSGPLYPDSANTSVLSGYAPSYTTEESEYWFYVIDGLRMSDVITVKVKWAPPSSISGKVLDGNGQPISGAIVGIKSSTHATADADQYLTTDSAGCYSSPVLASGTYYVASWKDSLLPTDDIVVNLSNEPVTVDMQLKTQCVANLILNSTKVATQTSAGDSWKTTMAVDGNLVTGWRSANSPASPACYFIDLGKPTDISAIMIYRYLQYNQYGGTRDDYQIDVMTNGNPLDPAAWVSNTSVKTVYSANRTMHGYALQSDVAVDPILLGQTDVRGIRIACSGALYPPYYEIREIQVYEDSRIHRISKLKSLPTGTLAEVYGKQVTSTPGGGMLTSTCYIEDTDRASGIRINTALASSPVLTIGDIINATGTLKSVPVTGEKYLALTKVSKSASVLCLKPVGMNSNSFSDPKNVGLLVTIWGKVDSSGVNYFNIKDGGKSAIKVMSGSLTKPSQGKIVRVTGIVSADGTKNILLMRAQSDWAEVQK